MPQATAYEADTDIEGESDEDDEAGDIDDTATEKEVELAERTDRELQPDLATPSTISTSIAATLGKSTNMDATPAGHNERDLQTALATHPTSATPIADAIGAAAPTQHTFVPLRESSKGFMINTAKEWVVDQCMVFNNNKMYKKGACPRAAQFKQVLQIGIDSGMIMDVYRLDIGSDYETLRNIARGWGRSASG